MSVMKVEEDFGYHKLVKEKVPNLPLVDTAAGYSAGLKAAADTYDTTIKELDKVLKEAASVPLALGGLQEGRSARQGVEHHVQLRQVIH